MVREDFNKNWIVEKHTANLVESVQGAKEEKTQLNVTLPHDAMIFEKRDKNSLAGSACGYFPGGDYEYSKRFRVEKCDIDKTFILEFEGIYNRGYIYVNGMLAGSIHYGYTGLFVDITPYLYFGEENRITVKAINADVPNSRWYTGSGIYRPVFLYIGGDIRMDANGLLVSTPEITDEIAAIKVDTLIRYDKKVRKTVTVKSEIIDSKGCITAEEVSQVTLFEQGNTRVTQKIYVKNPELWSVDYPNLYCCKVTIWDGEKKLDTARSTVGIRKLELNPLEGLKINGEKVLLRGGCIHHDNGLVGAAAFDWTEERRVKLLKEAGFNSVRIAHNSASKTLLNACDKLGMLVLEEIYDTWTQAKSQFDSALVFADNWEKDIEDIVKKDFNHPCVFMYSIGNEIKDLGTTEGGKWSRRLADKILELDSTRYVTNAVNGMMAIMEDLPSIMMDQGLLTPNQLQAMEEPAKEETSGGEINDAMTSLFEHMGDLITHPKVEERLKEAYGTVDVVGLNYMRNTYEQMLEYPNRIFYGSETFPPDIDLNWKKVKQYPACIGDYTWTAWDYIGEAGIGIVTYDGKNNFTKEYPAYLAYCGDMDITGYRRPISYFREIVFGLRKSPYIAVQLPGHYGTKAMCTPWSTAECISTWTWNGFEGKKCKVEVYSDAPFVELFVNENSVGKLPAGEENRFCAVFDTIYEPGEIKAVAYYEDGTKQMFSMDTADDEVSLVAKADRSEIEANELSYVTIQLEDAFGILHTAADRNIKISLEGPGFIQGFGSADPYSEENFFDRERMTYYGRALAVIRGGEVNGRIIVKVEAEGIKPVFVEIYVK